MRRASFCYSRQRRNTKIIPLLTADSKAHTSIHDSRDELRVDGGRGHPGDHDRGLAQQARHARQEVGLAAVLHLDQLRRILFAPAIGRLRKLAC